MNRKERRRQAKEGQKNTPPLSPLELAQKGAELANSGRLDAAVQAFRQAVALAPDYAEAHYNLGVLLRMQGHLEAAIESYRNALAIQPDFPNAHYNTGNANLTLGRLEEAAESYRQAIALRADFAEAHNNLGNVYKELEKFDEALVSCDKALAIKPDYAEALSNKGAILRDMGNPEESLLYCQKAIEHAPQYAQAYNNLGLAFQDTGNLDAAIEHFKQAMERLAEYPEAYSNLGIALQASARLEEAAASYQKALDIDANCVEAHNNFGMLQLLRGDFDQGWQNFAWQWQMKGATTIARHYPQPFWNGDSFERKTLFIYPVQGFGDFIQFSRYVPLAKAKGGRVIIEVPAQLHALFADMEAVDVVISSDQKPQAFDIQARLLDLPGLFNTSLENIPAVQPLNPPNDLMDKWRERLKDFKGRRVGLVWAGNPDHKNDRNRSINPEMIKPLLDIEGIDYFSLQVGRDGEADLNFGDRMVNLAPEFSSFAETAAAMKNLDIIISVDSAPAHLAGALGCQTWTLLPFAPDWRWLMDREDSPWYPSMRLFRQPAIGDWSQVMEQVGKALCE